MNSNSLYLPKKTSSHHYFIMFEHSGNIFFFSLTSHIFYSPPCISIPLSLSFSPPLPHPVPLHFSISISSLPLPVSLSSLSPSLSLRLTSSDHRRAVRPKLRQKASSSHLKMLQDRADITSEIASPSGSDVLSGLDPNTYSTYMGKYPYTMGMGVYVHVYMYMCVYVHVYVLYFNHVDDCFD